MTNQPTDTNWANFRETDSVPNPIGRVGLPRAGYLSRLTLNLRDSLTMNPQSENPSAQNPANSSDLYQFDGNGALLSTALPLPRRSGKVRDVYDLGSGLLIVSTDRISAFDYILPNGIPGKGELLTRMSGFWFESLDIPHHLVSLDVPDDLANKFDVTPLAGRIMVTAKADVVPFECVVRGYLEGSGWREYQAGGSVCGVELPAGLRQCDRLPRPIFTPATKADEGHDENVSFDVMAAALGAERANHLRDLSLQVFDRASRIAQDKGIIIADTKFEFGVVDDDRVILIDEVLTPDSSRFWSADIYQPGHSQPSFDKQFVREYLSQCGWDKNSPPPVLPAEIVEKTAEKYAEAYRRLAS
ncbi:Phosphoribosylaminoimidazole-succinocarboxamide synthase [Crateriforma conspicua]|uniref:Phosphoribosylaminoimidazole-succinocarboxamide synthase n=2 Tax=Crateriforma conspicua TaxID=2527996 RepID=A0A5C5Y616_9PLAN|nr:Phosphoribosylaminoimidazole-succinocarboxamide synthase [Crateriforma conspicua]